MQSAQSAQSGHSAEYIPPHLDHDPHQIHARLMADIQPRLRFHPDADYQQWQQQLQAAFTQRIGLLPQPISPRVQWDAVQSCDGYTRQRLRFEVEPGAWVPAWLLRPLEALPQPSPAVICLQGHTTGAHISIGEERYPGDAERLAGGRDFAIQVVRAGCVALAMEQRCFGERVDGRPLAQRLHFKPDNAITDERCRHSSMVALMLGRTMMGERSWDVARAIDVLETLAEVDAQRIAVMGHSGGGATGFYATCLDQRIAGCVLSGAVCTYAAGLGSIDSCSDNYLPGALLDFDMQDLVGLIAPRPMVVVTGETDHICPLDGAREAMGTIDAIYHQADARANVVHIVGDGGHRFFPEQAWPSFFHITGWK